MYRINLFNTMFLSLSDNATVVIGLYFKMMTSVIRNDDTYKNLSKNNFNIK